MTKDEFRHRLDVAKALSAGIPCFARVKADGLPWLPIVIEDRAGCWNPAVIFFDPYEVRIDYHVDRASA